MHNRKGVSKVEIVITMLVICVAVGVAAAGFVSVSRRAERSACATSRGLLARLYEAHSHLDGDCTLGEALGGQCETFNALTNGRLTCPSGGTYTIVGDGVIVCDRHRD